MPKTIDLHQHRRQLWSLVDRLHEMRSTLEPQLASTPNRQNDIAKAIKASMQLIEKLDKLRRFSP